MLRFIVSQISSRASHPVLVGLFLTAGVFFLAGVAVESTTGNGVAAGFLALYALMTTALAVFGYMMVFLGKGVQKFRRQSSFN